MHRAETGNLQSGYLHYDVKETFAAVHSSHDRRHSAATAALSQRPLRAFLAHQPSSAVSAHDRAATGAVAAAAAAAAAERSFGAKNGFLVESLETSLL